MHIIGASGHAKVVADILKLINQPVLGVWDDNEQLETFLTFPINGSLKQFKAELGTKAIITIGNNNIRKAVAGQLNSEFGQAIHPACTIAVSVQVAEGTVAMANVTVNADAVIGKHVILNTNCSVDHDCKIGDFVHISPQAGLAGNVEVGEGTHIGIGASIIQGITIGKWATIGAGTVVIRDVPDYAVVVGNPGKIIKYNPTNHEQ